MRETRRIAEETDKTKLHLSPKQSHYTKVLHILRSMLLKATEHERAAHSLASAKASITMLIGRVDQDATSFESTRSTSNTTPDASNLSVSDLSDRANRLESGIVTRTHELLSQVLVSGGPFQVSSGGNQVRSGEESLLNGEGSDKSTAGAEAAIRSLRARVLAHILRTLHVLNKGGVAQTILSESVVYPLAR